MNERCGLLPFIALTSVRRMTNGGLVYFIILIEVIKFNSTLYMVCCFAFVNTSLSVLNQEH